MKTYTKESLIAALHEIKNLGWIPNARPGNVGGVGNTLEDLLGIQENNLPIPNASEWELKCQRVGTTSLTTLFHMEPSPRALKFVPSIFLPKYGWKHELAGINYSANEMSFRQTIHGLQRSDRGFMVEIDKSNRKVLISLDASKVDFRHAEWLETVKNRVGLGELDPQPYWGFDDLYHKAGTKLLNTFYVQAEVMKEGNKEFFHYNHILILRGFSVDNFVAALVEGNVLVDFDARSGHNHGTKFRLRKTQDQSCIPIFWRSCKAKSKPTQRAPDWWESPRFQAVSVARSWFRQNGVLSSRPPAGNASRWAAVA